MNRRSSYNINVTEYKCVIKIKLNVGKKVVFVYVKSIGIKMNDLDLCLDVV